VPDVRIQLRGTRVGMIRYVRRFLQRAAGSELSGDPGRPQAVIGEFAQASKFLRPRSSLPIALHDNLGQMPNCFQFRPRSRLIWARHRTPAEPAQKPTIAPPRHWRVALAELESQIIGRAEYRMAIGLHERRYRDNARSKPKRE
jgi:hypothetical protein